MPKAKGVLKTKGKVSVAAGASKKGVPDVDMYVDQLEAIEEMAE